MTKRFRVAIIGSTGRGDYGHGLDEAWTDLPNVELVGVADDNEAGLAKTAAKLGLHQAFADYRKMLDTVKPDIVTIGARWLDQHRDMALAAAEHGIIEILEGILPSVTCLRDRSWAPPRSGKAWEEITSQGIGKPETLTGPRYAARHQLALEDLLSAIQEQRQPKCNMYEARGATEMIVAVFESHRQRKAVTLPLENRENPLAMLE